MIDKTTCNNKPCLWISLPAPDVNPSDVLATGTDHNNLVISWKVGLQHNYRPILSTVYKYIHSWVTTVTMYLVISKETYSE